MQLMEMLLKSLFQLLQLVMPFLLLQWPFLGNIAVTGNVQVDDIVEKTSGHGVELKEFL